MSLNQDLRRKYAYNINDSTRGKKISISSGKDFLLMHRGFYDDIENKSISIKQKEKQLRKIKNNSLKEFVFTNKQIPEKWKKKLSYQKDVIKILAKDDKFLYYVGRAGPSQSSMSETFSTKMYTTDSFDNTGKNFGLKTSYSQIFPKIGTKYTEKKNLNIDLNKNEHKTLEEEIASINDKSVSNSKLPKTNLKINKKDAMTDKDIANLLEEFRTAYPIKIKKDEPSEESRDKQIENQKNMFYNLSSTLLQTKTRYNAYDNIHKIRAKRQRAFRQNIFNNLIPPKDKNTSNSMININPKEKLRKLKINKKEEKFGPFLNFDYETFYKKVKINNPIIERQLENINFYGPYYSYCPLCSRRNLEYYNHLEHNQCLKLIHFIRKMRGKKNFINIKESTSTSEKKSEKRLASFDDNLNDNETIVEKRESVEFTQKD